MASAKPTPLTEPTQTNNEQSPTANPQSLISNLQSPFPAEMRALGRWVCWQAVARRGDPKPAKVPMNPHDGRYASTTNPKTWATFDQTAAALEKYAFSGLGFVLAAEDGLVGIDLDHCLDADGRPFPWAEAIIAQLDSYAERSPGGRGVHILARGAIPAAVKTPPVEIYSHSRYFTMTGDHLEGTPLTLEARQEQLDALCRQWRTDDRRPRARDQGPRTRDQRPTTDDRRPTTAVSRQLSAVSRQPATHQSHDQSTIPHHLFQTPSRPRSSPSCWPKSIRR